MSKLYINGLNVEVKRNLTRIRPASVGIERSTYLTSEIIQRMWKKEKLGGIN